MDLDISTDSMSVNLNSGFIRDQPSNEPIVDTTRRPLRQLDFQVPPNEGISEGSASIPPRTSWPKAWKTAPTLHTRTISQLWTAR